MLLRSRFAALAVPLAAVALATCLSATAPAQVAPPEQAASAVPTMHARQSDLLVQMMGMNVHLLDGKSPYGDFPRVLRALKTLGVRHIRTEYVPSRKDLAAEIGEMAAAGIRSELVMSDTGNTSVLPTAVKSLTALPAGSVDGVEPMNEWNLVGPPDWASQDQTFLRRLYGLVRAQPALDSTKVLGPSLGLRTGYGDLGNLSRYLDYGNIHLYPGGAEPTNRVDDQLANESTVAGSKRIVVSEAGYHNALHCGCTHPPITEHFAAVYEPRLFLDYFLQPRVRRVYQYELYDTGAASSNGLNGHFGLLRYDSSAKPSFAALRNLVSLAADPGRQFTPTPLAVTVTPGPDADTNPVQRVLVERRDGTYTLFVWRDVSVWDQKAQQPAPVHPEDATITFGQPVTSATLYEPTAGASPISTESDPTSLTLPLGGQVDAIRIVPAH